MLKSFAKKVITPVCTFGQIAVFGLVLSSCSPTTFTGDAQDKALLNQESNRQVSVQCKDLDLSKSTLDVASLKATIKCINNNGRLDALARLLEIVPQEYNQVIVDTLNQHLLSNPKLMFELETTYDQLTAKKVLDPLFVTLADFTKDAELIRNVLNLLKIGGTTKNSLGLPEMDIDLLKMIEVVFKELDPATAVDALNLAISVTSSEPAKVLTQYLSTATPEGEAGDSVQKQVESFVNYLKITKISDPKHYESGRELLTLLADSPDKLKHLSKLLLGDIADYPKTVPEVTSGLKVLLKPNTYRGGSLLRGESLVFSAAKDPISCMKGAATIPALVEFFLDEIYKLPKIEKRSFVQNKMPVLTALMNSACELPIQVTENASVLARLADTDGFHSMLNICDTSKEAGVRQYIFGLMGDTGSVNFLNYKPFEHGSLLLLPMLMELNALDLFDNAILLATSLEPKRFDQLSQIARFLLKPRPELNGRAMIDLTSKIANGIDTKLFTEIVIQIHNTLRDGKSSKADFFKALRSSFYVNNIYPFLDLMRDIGSHASQKATIISVLFELAQYKEFSDTISAISTMAEDGTLKDLVSFTLSLFHQTSEKGKYIGITLTEEPPFQMNLAHRFVALHTEEEKKALGITGDVIWIKPVFFKSEEALLALDDSCRKIDPTVDYLDAGYGSSLWSNSLSCMKTQSQAGFVIADSIDTMGRAPLELLTPLLHIAKDAKQKLSPEDNKFFLKAFQTIQRDNLLDDVFKAGSEVLGNGNVNESTLVSVSRSIRKILFNTKLKLDALLLRLESDLGIILKGVSFDKIKPLYDEYILKTDQITEKREPVFSLKQVPLEKRYNFKALKTRIQNTECLTNQTDIDRRADELINEYENAVTVWDLVEPRPYQPDPALSIHAKNQRFGYEYEEYMSMLSPLLEKYFDPNQNNPDYTLTDASLNLLRYFSLPDGQKPNQDQHYNVSYFEDWLYNLANEHRIISYWYPGEDSPRAKIISGIDHLESVVINSDFVWKDTEGLMKDNQGYSLLQMMGEAWGDEPREVWPKEIQEKYKKKRPLTLAEASKKVNFILSSLTKLLGTPEVSDHDRCAQHGRKTNRELKRVKGIIPAPTDVRARLYNDKQALVFVDEMLPGSKNPKLAGSLKVLRDMFFELVKSSPKECQNSKSGSCNNLSVIARLAKLGLTRFATRQLMFKDRVDPTRNDMFAGLILAASHPEVNPVVKKLLRQDREFKTVTAVMKQVYSTLDNGSEIEIENMKAMAYYFFGILGRLGEVSTPGFLSGVIHAKKIPLTYGSKVSMMDSVVKLLGPILGDYPKLLEDNVESFRDVFKEEEGKPNKLVPALQFVMGDLERIRTLQQNAKENALKGTNKPEPSENDLLTAKLLGTVSELLMVHGGEAARVIGTLATDKELTDEMKSMTEEIKVQLGESSHVRHVFDNLKSKLEASLAAEKSPDLFPIIQSTLADELENKRLMAMMFRVLQNAEALDQKVLWPIIREGRAGGYKNTLELFDRAFTH